MSAPLPPTSHLNGAISRAAGRVLPALTAAANRTGTDFNALFHTARLESGFNPEAKASTSSATGLFQFIESTWLSTLAKHGPKHGIAPSSRSEALALRRNPEVSSLMAAEHMADNKARLEAGLGRPATAPDLYLAHFLGAGGALDFLSHAARNPAQAAASLMPAAARANRAIFFESGIPRSLAAVQQLLTARFTGTSAPPARAETGTAVPPTRAETGTASPVVTADARAGGLLHHMPPSLSALLAAASGTASDQDASTGQDPLFASLLPSPLNTDKPIDPRHAAQAAYLLLAQLGA